MILAFVDSTLFAIVDPNKPDAHQTQPYAHDLARMRAWGQRAPEPFEVCVTEPPRDKLGGNRFRIGTG
jgi:hypothetical protein